MGQFLLNSAWGPTGKSTKSSSGLPSLTRKAETQSPQAKLSNFLQITQWAAGGGPCDSYPRAITFLLQLIPQGPINTRSPLGNRKTTITTTTTTTTTKKWAQGTHGLFSVCKAHKGVYQVPLQEEIWRARKRRREVLSLQQGIATQPSVFVETMFS